jgi:hypothetical protein
VNRLQVESSNIRSIAYDDASSTLDVEFNNGGCYQYFDVPRPVYNEMVAVAASGESVGKYLNSQVKGTYRYARV